jgi:hypothetical protein
MVGGKTAGPSIISKTPKNAVNAADSRAKMSPDHRSSGPGEIKKGSGQPLAKPFDRFPEEPAQAHVTARAKL